MNKLAKTSASPRSHPDKQYVYINYNLMNLSHAGTDIHDFSFFINTNSLKHMKQFPTYPTYQIGDMHLSPPSSPADNKAILTKNTTTQEAEVVASPSLICLNEWFHSIVEFIKLNKSSISCSTNQQVELCCPCNTIQQQQQHSNCNDYLQKQIDQTSLFKSFLVRFFLDSLNGNLFKLKNLIAFVDECVSSLSAHLADVAAPATSTTISLASVDLSSEPLDNSPRSLLVLREIHTFLASPCTFNLFKSAIKKCNTSMAKNHLILTDINMIAGSSSGISSNDVALAATRTLNNNDEHFKDMNQVTATLNLIGSV